MTVSSPGLPAFTPVEWLLTAFMLMLMLGIPAIALVALVVNVTAYFVRQGREDSSAIHPAHIACPACGESVAAAAIRCRFCGKKFGRDELHRVRKHER